MVSSDVFIKKYLATSHIIAPGNDNKTENRSSVEIF